MNPTIPQPTASAGRRRIVAFDVPGPPVAKGRARLTTINGSTRAYTPAKTRAYEADAATVAAGAMGPNTPIDGPVRLFLDVRLPVPPSWSRKRRSAALSNTELPCSRPDVDNYAKAIADALNGIVYHDDCQIVSLFVAKRYSDEPGVGVRVEAAGASS